MRPQFPATPQFTKCNPRHWYYDQKHPATISVQAPQPNVCTPNTMWMPQTSEQTSLSQHNKKNQEPLVSTTTKGMTPEHGNNTEKGGNISFYSSLKLKENISNGYFQVIIKFPLKNYFLCKYYKSHFPQITKSHLHTISMDSFSQSFLPKSSTAILTVNFLPWTP